MAIKWTKRVWNSPEPSNTSERLVLLALADFADENTGECWPSIATLARMCRMSKRWISELLRRLDANGFIIRTVHPGRSSIYQLLWNQPPPIKQTTKGHEQTICTPTNRRSGGDERSFLTPMNGNSPITTNEPNNEPLNKPPPAGGCDEYDLILALQDRGLKHDVEGFVASHPHEEIRKQIAHYDYLIGIGRPPHSPGWIKKAVAFPPYDVPPEALRCIPGVILNFDEAMDEYQRLTGGGSPTRPFKQFFETVHLDGEKVGFKRISTQRNPGNV